MQELRNYVLTIAGFDPSGGAGLTADIKTFEQHQVYGLAVCSAITLQTGDEFFEIRWEKTEDVIKAMDVLLSRYPVNVVKTGILPSIEFLDEIVNFITSKFKAVSIIVDPVFRSSTGFDFVKDFSKEKYYSILKKCFLITPNTNEAVFMAGISNESAAAKEISAHCNVFLKGGHSVINPAVDFLFTGDDVHEFKPSQNIKTGKHGSGCILSAAVAARLALGHSLTDACQLSKEYAERALGSNHSLLTYHHVS